MVFFHFDLLDPIIIFISVLLILEALMQQCPWFDLTFPDRTVLTPLRHWKDPNYTGIQNPMEKVVRLGLTHSLTSSKTNKIMFALDSGQGWKKIIDGASLRFWWWAQSAMYMAPNNRHLLNCHHCYASIHYPLNRSCSSNIWGLLFDSSHLAVYPFCQADPSSCISVAATPEFR